MVLSAAKKRGSLTESQVAQILSDGPKGVVQIAQVFGSPHSPTDLTKAQNRLINLISLGLEDISK